METEERTKEKIATELDLMTVGKCALLALKKVPICLPSRAESALLTCCRALKVPFFSNLTMPFFRAGGNTTEETLQY